MERKDPITKPVQESRAVPTTLQNLPSAPRRKGRERETELPPSYQVKKQDVLCGNRGARKTYRHTGNQRFRVVVEMRLERYNNASRRDKSELVKEIVHVVRSYGGNFVRRDDADGKYYDIGNIRARE